MISSFFVFFSKNIWPSGLQPREILALAQRFSSPWGRTNIGILGQIFSGIALHPFSVGIGIDHAISVADLIFGYRFQVCELVSIKSSILKSGSIYSVTNNNIAPVINRYIPSTKEPGYNIIKWHLEVKIKFENLCFFLFEPFLNLTYRSVDSQDVKGTTFDVLVQKLYCYPHFFLISYSKWHLEDILYKENEWVGNNWSFCE